MKPQTSTMAPSRDYDYPMVNTKACQMLKAAVEKAQDTKGWSQRYISDKLGYKNSVVLSHMVTGRIQISIDRAMDFSRVLSIPPGEFLLAVLEQRHPEIDFRKLFQIDSTGKSAMKVKANEPSALLNELESIAGMPVDQLPMPTIKVLRAAVADAAPQRRWLEPHEMSIVDLIRKNRPDGLSADERRALESMIA